MKREQWEQQFRWGITAFMVIAASVLVAGLMVNFGKIRIFFKFLIGILAPIIYGAVLAYITAPLYNLVFEWIYLDSKGKLRHSPMFRVFARGVATLLSLGIVIVVAVGLVWLIIPQLYTSLSNLVATLPQDLSQTYRNAMEYLQDYPELRDTVQQYYNAAYEFIMNFLQDHLMPNMQSIVASLGIGIWSVLSWFKNIIIGLIVMLYLLNIKESMLGESRKLVFALLPEKWAARVVQEFSYINAVFGGFIIGKLIDSLIIGILCFICLQIMKMPYAMLVSVIVGVTNVIPFFGPFIGAVPSFVLILLNSPMQSLYFLIFILVLQQFDGNILGPRVLGNSTGLSSFWVLFAILLFGGLFGFVGMIVGVPLWAVILNFIRRCSRHMLRKKGLPTEGAEYVSGKELERMQG